MSDEAETKNAATQDDWVAALGDKLEKAGLITSDSVHMSAHARVLLLGPMKSGKTVALARTAPKPLIINCDGVDATAPAADFAKRDGKRFVQFDVHNVRTWLDACQKATKLAQEGLIETVIVDTVTQASDDLQWELQKAFSGFDLWRELGTKLREGLRPLLKAPAHLFVVAHMDPRTDSLAGVIPLIQGDMVKVWLPGRLNDWVLFQHDVDRDERNFLVGPQKKWAHGGRSFRGSEIIEADVELLLEVMGLKPT